MTYQGWFREESVSRTFARCATDGTGQDGVLLACAAIEQVTAVSAKDEGANGGHFRCVYDSVGAVVTWRSAVNVVGAIFCCRC
jgi:hypothetical protein